MPSRPVHRLFEKKLLRYSNERLTTLMDMPWVLFGSHHRKVWGHDLASIVILSMIAGGDVNKNIQQGLLHLALDNYFSSLKKKLVKRGMKPEVVDMMMYHIAKEILKEMDK